MRRGIQMEMEWFCNWFWLWVCEEQSSSSSLCFAIVSNWVGAMVLACGMILGWMEFKDMHLKYSKFNSSASSPSSNSLSLSVSLQKQISSKWGMFWIYFPSLLFSLFFVLGKLIWPPTNMLHLKLGVLNLALTLLQPDRPLSFPSTLTAAAVAVHFFKRVYEVLFIHRYSGTVGIGTVILISIMYAFNAVLFLYSLQAYESLRPVSGTLFVIGAILFVMGLSGNLYHHFILSTLRKDGSKQQQYYIPEAGLFKFVVCPHYLFEITGFVGLALLAQTVFGFCTAGFVFFYLLGRSLSTKSWYLKKFENFPSHRKALIPFIL